MHARSRTAGFTLMELVIAMGLLSVVLLAIGTLQGSMFTSFVSLNGSAARGRELQDASGYLADRLHSASAVSTALTVNGVACQITPPVSVNPCFALLIPETRQVGAVAQYSANVWMYVVYMYVPRASLPPADRPVDAWADANAGGLLEYRTVICQPNAVVSNVSGTCSTDGTSTGGMVPVPKTIPVAITGMTPYVVMDSATTDQLPAAGAFQPFAYDPLTSKFTLNLRAKTYTGGKVMYTPASGPLVVTAVRRN